MKEITYAWYPSVSNIYRPKGKPSSHHLKCLYNFKEYQGQMVYPEPELFVRGVASTTQLAMKQKCKSAPVPKLCKESKIYIPTPTQCWSKNKTLPETEWGVIDDMSTHLSNPSSEVNWPISQDGKQQQMQQKYLQPNHSHQQQLFNLNFQHQKEKYLLERSQTPQPAFGLHKFNQESPACSEASSITKWSGKQKALRPQSSYSSQFPFHQQDKIVLKKQRPVSSPGQSHRDIKSSIVPSPPNERNAFSSKFPVRPQSATVCLFRDKTHQPARPITAASNQSSGQEQEIIGPDDYYSELERPPTRPAAPIPFANDVNEMVCDLEEATKPPTSPSPRSNEDDYEMIVEKYGWRAQIHGDPYQLKKPMKRESYIVNCKAPELLPDSPAVFMETKEPFFYNTIPRKPQSFSINREWMSEVILAKRLELQKREGGIKYNYKNFAFVY